MSERSPIDTRAEFPPGEIDEAFQHYWSLGGAGERWDRRDLIAGILLVSAIAMSFA